ncbi:pyrroline-5-carboxylate reductase [Limnoglobus roseus]|uniref:Pyrroline-5-carboxylate reductase n=1 Tax=Limnoglobus roseus TaxID=2598579 RepID=A0A5C1A5V4_9BACT|nr:pyrroline-5-carboxylate reductase [Limnoglobus roseus]QEL14559.1 pyrroline-5-carboxylate reductase [Limnoglobus roseus]
MTTPLAIGFLGAGQMATALAKGWAAAGLLDANRSAASDPYPAPREKFTATTNVRAVESNAEVVAKTDVIILAVKPQTMSAALAEVRSSLTDKKLVVSIAAGITLKQLAENLGTNTRLVRVMPNTPCLLGASAAGFAVGPAATKADGDLVARLFNAVGKAYAVPESQLDAVTGLSGSGPAFVYVLIEALADGGVRVGLPRDIALSLAAQTVFGSAKMVLETGTHPAALKDAVASPGGTTIAGLHALERAGFRAAAMDAVEAAAKRATELGSKN